MEEAVVKRIMPHSLEAERSVIGAMLMDHEAIVASAEAVTKEDFYQQSNGIIYEAIMELYNQGQPVDVVTVQERLREKDVPPEVSSTEYVAGLIAAVPTSVNINKYAEIVAEKSVLRRLIRINEQIANQCYAGKDSLERILADTEHIIPSSVI